MSLSSFAGFCARDPQGVALYTTAWVLRSILGLKPGSTIMGIDALIPFIVSAVQSYCAGSRSRISRTYSPSVAKYFLFPVRVEDGVYRTPKDVGTSCDLILN